MKEKLRILICCIVCCLVLACSKNVSTKENAINSPLSPVPSELNLANSVAEAFLPFSSKMMSQSYQKSQQNQFYQSFGQPLSDTPFATSIFALHENIFPLKEKTHLWQPAKLVAIESINRPENGIINSRWAFKWDTTTAEMGQDGEQLHPQIVISGDWVRYDWFHDATSVGVQFACQETCGWGQIRVNNEVRWIGNTYKMTDYVEIYLLPNYSRSITVESLGHSGGKGSIGEVRFIGFGEGIRQRIFLPIVRKWYS